MTKQEAVAKVLERYKHLNIVNMVNNRYVPVAGEINVEHLINHYLGAVGDASGIMVNGCGTQYYVHRDGTIIQATNERAYVYHIGAKQYKHPTARNGNSLGIEMCVNCDGDRTQAGADWWFTEATQIATAALDVHLMLKYNISIDRLLRHYDVTGKTCPAPYVHNNGYRGSWTWAFMKDVVREVLRIVKNGEQDISYKTENICTGSKGMVTTANLNVREHPVTGDVKETISKGTVFYPVLRTHNREQGYYWFKFSKGWVCGKYVTGWICDKETGRWWYAESGNTIFGWKQIDGLWFYFGADGYMLTGWKYIDNKWFYLNDSGVMQTGWLNVGGKWYYLRKDGSMASNRWIKKKGQQVYYWVTSNGEYQPQYTADLEKYAVEEEF